MYRMPPKKEKKRKMVKIKAVAKNVNIINIGTSKRRTSKKSSSKAAVVQNIPIRTSPTIYNPAPTPFQTYPQPQSAPVSAYTEIMQELKRIGKTENANAIQDKEIVALPETSGASVVDPIRDNVEQPRVKNTRVSQKMKLKAEAIRLGLNTDGTAADLQERVGKEIRRQKMAVKFGFKKPKDI